MPQQNKISDTIIYTPQTSQVLESYSTTTTSTDKTQLNNIKTNHNTLSMPVTSGTNIPNSECTHNITNQMQPVTLFRSHKERSPSSSPESPSNDICENQEGEGSLDSSKHQSYQTKAGKMIERTIGKTSELGKFDSLRATMKNKMHKKQKPTVLEKEQYKILTSVLNLNTLVIAAKLDLKQQVKTFEKDFHKAQGTFPDRGTLNTKSYEKGLTMPRNSVSVGMIV